MKISDLLDNANFSCDTDIEFEKLTYRPEESDTTSLLFLLNDAAIEKFIRIRPQATAIVVENGKAEELNQPKIAVNNIRAYLSLAYKNFFCYDLSNITFIGITGTNGKSTTAIFLKEILKGAGKNVGLVGTGKIMINDEIISSFDYSMTTPPPDILYPTIAKMKNRNVDTIIMEVSSHGLAQERVFPIEFDIGIFTNLSAEHLDYHKDIDSYFKVKKRLFERSKLAIINTDDPYGKMLKETKYNSYSIGITKPADSMAESVASLGLEGTKFVYKDEADAQSFNLAIPASYNVYNALLAIRAAKDLGVSIRQSKIALENIKRLDGRFMVVHTDPTVIIDYAHTSLAFDNLMKNLFSCKNSRQKLCVVFGCGGERDKYKRSEMGKCAEKYADRIIITSDNPRGEDPMKIINDIICDMRTDPKIIVDRESAIHYAIENSTDDEIIAIVGKGPEKYSIENGFYRTFDEEEIVMNALKRRNNIYNEQP